MGEGKPVRERKDDRRTRYTRQVIRESFVHLLSQKSIAKITVKEICEEADVNRSTFYAHYADPYDLMQKIKDEVMGEIDTWLKGLVFPIDAPVSQQVMRMVFEYVAANAEMCKVSFGHLRRRGPSGRPDDDRAAAGDEGMVCRGGGDSSLSEYLLQFGVHASVAVVKKWLENGLREPPAEMAELVIRLIYHGLSSVMSRP
jgi:AcrR family transcriptional regulator